MCKLWLNWEKRSQHVDEEYPWCLAEENERVGEGVGEGEGEGVDEEQEEASSDYIC